MVIDFDSSFKLLIDQHDRRNFDRHKMRIFTTHSFSCFTKRFAGIAICRLPKFQSQ